MNRRCSPHKSSNEYTCFSHQELINLANSYNSFRKICKKNKECYPVKRIRDVESKTKQELYNDLQSRFQLLCKDESCWVSLDFIDKIPDKQFVHNLKYFTFKPKMSGGRWKWLSTMDINFVLKQYELVDPTFRFLGAQPSDFLKLQRNPEQLFNKSVLLNDNIQHLGLVLNIDPHNSPGSHWVAIYIENLNTLEYFDSTGDHFNKYPQIKRTIFKICKYLNIDTTIKINKEVHQTGDTECGVYSIYFIIQRILGNDFETVSKSIVKDNAMNLFRNVIFN